MKDIDAQNKLDEILGRVYRFPHNVNLTDLVGEVYGRTETNKSYLRSKVKLIERKGLTWWWCELDLAHQHRLAGLIIKRYPELVDLLT